MRWLVPISFLLPLTISTAAFAGGDQKSNCPPGSWFCESVSIGGGGDSDDAASAPKRADDDLAKSPDDAPTGAAKNKKRKRVQVDDDTSDAPDATPQTEADPDTVVIVRRRHRRGERVMVVRDGEHAAPRVRRERRWHETFGLNLRVEGAAFIPKNNTDVAGMGGAGLSFRWRPSPWFAFDLGTDIVGGNDWNNDERVEFSGSLSGILFFNPQHRVQVYAIGGVHLAHAEVSTACATLDYGYGGYGGYCNDATRNYFGGQAGLGLEFRIARHFGMFADGLGIIRTRIDSEQPEFVDANTGQTTNTSGAMLFRTGVNFWW